MILLFLSSLFIPSCSKRPPSDPDAYLKGIGQWQKDRSEGLQKENGWLTLCGLFWLSQGENKFGTDSTNGIIFPPGSSPGYAGSIFMEGGKFRFKCAEGIYLTCNDSSMAESEIKSDGSGKSTPTEMKLGALNFYIIKRGERYGLRLRDNENRSRREFKGLDYFPSDLKWRFSARFESYRPPKPLEIVNVLGQVSIDSCPGALVFEFERSEHRLDPLKEGNKLFIIFHDQTAGNETYGMGRFLYAEMPDSGDSVTLDFNKAYNPPCAFTEFATCPLPPGQNYLPFRVEAGEKKYDGPGHH